MVCVYKKKENISFGESEKYMGIYIHVFICNHFILVISAMTIIIIKLHIATITVIYEIPIAKYLFIPIFI